MAEGIKTPASRMSQMRLAGLLLGGILVLLAGGYFLFVRMQTVTLYEGLDTADAAALVDALEAQGIAYSLAEGGTAIRVAKQEADAIRLSLSGTLSPDRGLDGFELFNESDMGLTEFAQRIKYQRAIQGELARSILMIEGISRARVHIALPERSMFRAGQSRPTAAVTLTLTGAPDAGTIAGIQHMVAASVPDLRTGDVVVLDQSGRLLSEPAGEAPADITAEGAGVVPDAAPGAARDPGSDDVPALDLAASPAEAAPAAPVQASLEAALRAVLPDRAISILVSAPEPSGGAEGSPHVLIVSDAPLAEASRQAVTDILARTENPSASDSSSGRLEFLVRPQAAPDLPGPPPQAATLMAARQAGLPPPAGLAAFARRHIPEIAGVGGLLMIVLIALVLFARRRRTTPEGPQADFAAHLKAELGRQSGPKGR